MDDNMENKFSNANKFSDDKNFPNGRKFSNGRKISKQEKNFRLWVYFSVVIFVTILTEVFLLVLLWFILYKIGAASLNPFKYHLPLISMLIASIFIGASIAGVVSRVFIRPIRRIGDALEELAKGNFDVRVSTSKRSALTIRDIAERFNKVAYDLANVETLRNDFVVNVSHEFKTPIAAIEGYAALLQNHNLSAEKHDYYVEKILTNTHRLTNLTSNILTLSKLENQVTVLHKKEYMLDEQLRKTVLLLEDKWTAKNIEFDIELDEQPFYGNVSLLDQVWFNLIDNAIKHSHENGTIKVAVSSDKDSVTVEVTDYGDGMTEETSRHIFEKFYQGDSSHKAEGNGLGLALVKRIVELCEGTVAVKSEPGKGATFTVTLPVE